MSLNQGMDKENMEYYSAVKNNDIMKFAGEWMELKQIILSEAIQAQKDKNGKQIQKDQVTYLLQITIKPERVLIHSDFISLSNEPMCPSL
ncbi:hypothetical protein STEG23_011456 [Scotinomys teguina]